MEKNGQMMYRELLRYTSPTYETSANINSQSGSWAALPSAGLSCSTAEAFMSKI